ncbi:MAG: hypothetical protein R3282_05020, partial [Rhodothermales bacterium]|nr:hypothetical protein [Rhodothermales bacterium]
MKFRDLSMTRLVSVALLSTLCGVAAGQAPKGLVHPPHPPPPGEQGSPNIQVLSHIPLGAPHSVSDIEIEQDVKRPFAYVARRLSEIGFDVIDLSDPDNARVIHRWRIEDPDLHMGGAMDGRYFSYDGRNYYVQSVQLRAGTPN